jgi:hypothetical protein
MNIQLQLIQKKISSIQYGILRYSEDEEQKSVQVKVVVNGKDSVNCKIIDADTVETLLNKHVNIIQKKHNDYLFASGMVTNEARKTHIVSVKLTKACWFTKKKRGNVSWLQEVQKYDPFALRELKIA